ncbi:MAG: PD-(D/E)XK nuclease family protein, partial [Erysipelotrichaceae bacterium]|nr:PD-(D/E)XK nuclease family protein [Erysipelotrichaceae bacterium]
MKRLCYIAPPSFRTSLLQEHFYETELYEIKFLSLRDLLEAHFGSIDAVLATIFLFKKGYRDFIAIEMLLEKLRFIPLIITVNSPELLQLVTLKQELLAAGCISQKSTIFDLLKDPEATIYLAYQDHLKTGVFSIINDILKWHGINEVQPYLIPPINNHYFHRLLNEQEELLFSLNEIASLLDKGTKLESIRIMIPEHERLKISLKEMAARFNIPLRLNETILLKDLVIAKEFMKYYSLPHPVKTDLLKEFVHAAMNKPYPFKTEFLDYISLLMPKMDPLSSYDVRELLNYLFQLERFSLESDDHGVLVISPRDDAYDKHLFILGSNSEFYPPRIKEELPFNDLELQELGLLNYRRFNQNAINYHLLWHNYIYTKTTHVYYSKVFFSKNYLPFNPFYDQGAFLMKPASSSLETLYSKKAFQDYFYFMDYLHARYRLNFPLRSKLSQYFKKEPAPNYDFKNQNVSFLKSKDSVSRLNDFLLCPFRYYLDYVVNLRDFRPSIQTMIGTLLHQILEVYISLEPQDYDTIFDQRYQKLLLEENLTPVEQVIILNIRDFSHRCADVILNRIKSLNQKYQVQIFTEYHFDDENVGTIDLILVVGNFYFIL